MEVAAWWLLQAHSSCMLNLCDTLVFDQFLKVGRSYRDVELCLYSNRRIILHILH